VGLDFSNPTTLKLYKSLAFSHRCPYLPIGYKGQVMLKSITPEQCREADIILDVETATPVDLYHQVSQVLGEVMQCGVVVHLSRDNGNQIYFASFEGSDLEMPARLSASILKLAPALLEADLGSRGQNFDLSGRMTIDRSGDVFLDAEDFHEDWDHQHAIDTDSLSDVEFPTPDSDASMEPGV
jgi:hypothetical protein